MFRLPAKIGSICLNRLHKKQLVHRLSILFPAIGTIRTM
jgi:hypothetical protein